MPNAEPSVTLLKAVAVTSELCGRTFSGPAAAMFCDDLARYPEAAVLGALARCRREVRGALTVQDVVSRLNDGRPGGDEAWAMLPFDEAKTVVWTDEMAAAFGIVLPLLREGETTAARFAFREAYAKAVGQARDAGKTVTWWPTLGHDVNGRAAALKEAVDLGRLTYERAAEAHPMLPMSTRLQGLAHAAIEHSEARV